MKTMKITKRTIHALRLNDGVELRLQHAPDQAMEPLVKRTKTGHYVVGYLVHDDDCFNPCEDRDGMGHIYSFSHRHINSIDPNDVQSKFGHLKDFIVPLSYFEHGRCMWGVEGTMDHTPDFQWDGCCYAGIWVPDGCCLEEIRGAGRSKKAKLKRAEELAGQACKEYTAWANGECYGHVCEWYKPDGTPMGDNACWGYIGGDYAESEATDAVNRVVAQLEEEKDP